MQGLGGGTTAVGNATQDHEAAAGKKVRVRDIDAGMERRGRHEKKRKSTSTARIRQSLAAVRDKGGWNWTKGMHGLGLGSASDIEQR